MKNILIILCSVTWLFGCPNYLDVVPERDIETIESIFELRANADQWLEGVYAGVMGQVTNIDRNPAFFGADETIMCDVFRGSGYNGIFIAEGLQMSQEPYGNLWDDNLNDRNSVNVCSHYESIRSANVFLEHIDGVYNMEDREKREWKAEMLALKAFLYFDLVRHYGPIALVPENIPVETSVPDMAVDRVHVDTCFKEIVRLLDEAEPNLLLKSEKSSMRYAYFTKEAALALKAKVLLYAASPLFNGNEYYAHFKGKNGEPLFSSEYDPEKWRLAAEAADRAVEVCKAGQHKLYDGTASEGSVLLNTMYDLSYSVLSQFDNPEVILEWKDVINNYYCLVLPYLSSSDSHYNQRAKGGVCPTIKMVEMYYTENGLPIDADNTWNYSGRYRMAQESNPRYNNVVPLKTDVLQLHLRREPRFYASIAADRTIWQRGPRGAYTQNDLLVEAYKGERFGTTLDVVSSREYQNITGYWLKKNLYPEQETKYYSAGSNKTIPLIRMAELYLMQAEAWNEYEGPSQKVYDALDVVRERAGIPDVVTAWKSYSKDPGRVDSKEGMRGIIRQETNIELAFEGQRFWNLRRWKIAHEALNEKQYGWNILGEDARSFYNNFNGPVVVWSRGKFTVPRDYLFPIKAEEVLISGVIQNPGW